MFEALTQRLDAIFDRLRGAGRLTEENIQEALREVRVALLEADVNFKVVRSFVERVREKAVGHEVLQSLTPGQQVVKIVHGELVDLLGGAAHRLTMAPRPPTVIMVLGLQGSGKTTSVAKLGPPFPARGIPAAPGRRRHLPARRHPAAPRPRRRARAARARGRGAAARPDRARGPGPGRGARMESRPARHRRAPSHRRGDGRGAQAAPARGQAPSRPPGRRRDDRPGCGDDGPAVQPGRGL